MNTPYPSSSPFHHDPSTDGEAVDDALDELDVALELEPAWFMNTVCRELLVCPTCAHSLLTETSYDACRPVRAAATVAQWFLGVADIEVKGIDLPSWLRRLDAAVVSTAKHRIAGDGSSYLLDVELADGHRFSAQIRVSDQSGGIRNAFVVDDPIEFLETLMGIGQPREESFHPVPLPDAATALIAALGRSRIAPVVNEFANPWPGNEPLVAWLIGVAAASAGDTTHAASVNDFGTRSAGEPTPDAADGGAAA